MRLLVLALLAASCGKTEVPCTTAAECGPMQACLAQACVDVACLSGADCTIESFCNPETYTCDPGCLSSDDCLVGDRCDVTTHSCVPRSCHDTQLDCDLGERCDTTRGACVKDPEPYCEPCARDEACGPHGICARLSGAGGAYCILECSPESFDPCPAGLQCSFQQTSVDDPGQFFCVGLCDRL
ncbi:MAG TPA: hypothetical protein PKA64_14855 [Myxococcota bacterium]|nr:hypothetical protein [Myxococcota bacterium]